MSEKCKAKIFPKGVAFPRERSCKFNAVKDGYCATHHPESVKLRREKAETRSIERMNNRPEMRAFRMAAEMKERAEKAEKEVAELRAEKDAAFREGMVRAAEICEGFFGKGVPSKINNYDQGVVDCVEVIRAEAAKPEGGAK